MLKLDLNVSSNRQRKAHFGANGSTLQSNFTSSLISPLLPAALLAEEALSKDLPVTSTSRTATPSSVRTAPGAESPMPNQFCSTFQPKKRSLGFLDAVFDPESFSGKCHLFSPANFSHLFVQDRDALFAFGPSPSPLENPEHRSKGPSFQKKSESNGFVSADNEIPVRTKTYFETRTHNTAKIKQAGQQ